MKRMFIPALFLCILLLCVCFPLLSLAENAKTEADVTDSLTPEEFASFAGQVVFVLLVVQLIKLPIDLKLCKIRTEYIVYGVAVIAQMLAQGLLYGFKGFTWAFIPKCIAYAFLVAVTAKEVYVKAIGNVEAKKAELMAKAWDFERPVE